MKIALTPFLALILSIAAAGAIAQDWPRKPLRIIVPFAPGGVADNSARVVAEPLGARLGQQVIVENRPGASGNIGTQAVAESTPDGYTLLLGFDGTMVINPHVFAKMPFDTLYDFAPVTKLGDATLILVAHPSLPAKNLNELIALARTRPLAYGTSGTGGTPHLAGELLGSAPAPGSSTYRTRAAARRSPTWSAARSRSSSRPSPRRSSTCAPGALSASACRAPSARRRCPMYPPSRKAASRRSMSPPGSASSRRPRHRRRSSSGCRRELAQVLRTPFVKERYGVLGIEPVGNTPREFFEQVRADLARWEKVVKSANIKVE